MHHFNEMNPSYYRLKYTQQKNKTVIWSAMTEYVQPFIPTHARVLDIGAGHCLFINNIQAKEKHALDKSDHIKEYAHENVTVHIQSCSALANFSVNFFDVIFAGNILDELDRKEFNDTLNEIKRVLKADGILILLQTNHTYAKNSYFDEYSRMLILTDTSLADFLTAKDFSILVKKSKFLPSEKYFTLFPYKFLIKWYLCSPIKPCSTQMLIIAMNKKNTIKDYLES